MQTTRLGRTGLEVSVAGLGTGGRSRIGQVAGLSEDQSADLLRHALDLGVNLIDTAGNYGTEAIVGRALEGRRDGVILSTKARVNRKGTPAEGDDLVDGDELRRGIEESLRLLRTDRVDILHLHGVRINQYDHCVQELLPVLRQMRAEGKIRFIGITETFGVDTTHETLRRSLGDGFWDVVMLGLNFVNATARHQILPAAIDRDVGTLGMYAVRGALTRPEALLALAERLAGAGEMESGSLSPASIALLLKAAGASSLPELAYRFCRHTPGLHTVLFGTGSREHLRDNIEAINGPKLPPEVLESLDRIFGAVVSASGDPV